MAEKKKYNYMENVLINITSKFISLPDKEVKRNNRILESVLKTIVDAMKKKDPLFKDMFTRVFYGGSYYDGLRVGKPEEFDLDLLLSLPKYAAPVLTTSKMPGFVHLQLQKFDDWLKQPEAMPTYRLFGNLFDEKRFLSTKKVLAWMEGILTKTMDDLPLKGNKRILENKEGTFEIMISKSGPALTLKISGAVTMDVDLVTCFVFREDKWPKEGFKPNPVPTKPEFFIVPKKPKAGEGDDAFLYWRLSFQEQERVLMDNKRVLKPTIKLLKKLRDNLKHSSIASYYIKTAVLHIAETKPDDFWKNSLSYVFMTVLKEYKEFIEKGNIPYYWNTSNNLVGAVNAKTLENMANRLKVIINDVEKKANEPTTIAKYLLSSEEYNEFMLERLKL
ncbi:cyclic GMP-AMP synthase-like receptor [Tenebrio molitor]|uniref:cyclic GMP-AMP synthase-like receptor n=1 Tax=Tenebrio molitor TaxID=7067 RepID=UPI0036247C1C